MTTAEDPINTVTTALRGAVDKAVDLMDSSHLHSLGDASHEVASRVLAATPDLAARLGPTPADLQSLRVSTARRAHQIADSIEERADALAPSKAGGHRWLKLLLVLGLFGATAWYLSRRLTQKRAASQRVNEHDGEEEAVANGSATGATAGEAPDTTMGTPDSSESGSNGARSKSAHAN